MALGAAALLNRSVVVSRRPHFLHSRRRQIYPSRGLVAMTRVALPQVGQVRALVGRFLGMTSLPWDERKRQGQVGRERKVGEVGAWPCGGQRVHDDNNRIDGQAEHHDITTTANQWV